MFILLLAVILSSCYADRMLEYYADESNFQTVTGTVTYVGFSDDRQTLYLSISNLPEGFSSKTFEIVGKNLDVVKKTTLVHKLSEGAEVEFVSAPRYFWDGYVMPIVALSVDGYVLLDYERGYSNYMEWLKTK
jgi:hypothetical protein